jgi:hypothetical protein
MAAFVWADEAEVSNALEDLRNPATDTKWVVLGYKPDSKLKLLATGAGGIDDFLPHLPDDSIRYIVYSLHVKDQDEAGDFFGAEKTIFITWVGTKCKPMIKAKSSQHRRPLYQYVLKYLQLGAELQVLEPSELSQAVVLEKIRGTRFEAEPRSSRAGTESTTTPTTTTTTTTTTTPKPVSPSTTTDRRANTSSTSSTSSGPRASSGTQSAVLEFVDEADANAKLEDVRDDKSDTNWVVYGHEGAKLKVLGSGSGGLGEMEAFFTEGDIVYGVLAMKVKDEDGGSEYATTKYVFISWVGPAVKPLVKARSSQVRVALYRHAKTFLQLAAEMQVLDRADISEQKILEKLNSVF